MKKIKYSIHSGAEGKPWAVEIPYSEENLAIAQAEALEGAYTVEEGSGEKFTELTLADRVSALERSAPAPAEYAPGTWYYRGDRVSFEGGGYICIAPAGVVCVWSPADYPTYWQAV